MGSIAWTCLIVFFLILMKRKIDFLSCCVFLLGWHKNSEFFEVFHENNFSAQRIFNLCRLRCLFDKIFARQFLNSNVIYNFRNCFFFISLHPVRFLFTSLHCYVCTVSQVTPISVRPCVIILSVEYSLKYRIELCFR